MARFYYYTANRLREIFSEHCNLTVEQYAALTERLEELVDMYQENRPEEETEKQADDLRVIFDFMLDAKELTLKEHMELHEMLEEMAEQAEKIRAEEVRKILTEGTVL